MAYGQGLPSPSPTVTERDLSIPQNETLSARLHRSELSDLKAIRLVGVDIDLSDSLIGNRDAYVYGYEVRLPAKLTLSEKNLFVFARVVRCDGGGSTIDVSGKDGGDKFKAAMGVKPGAPGSNGQPGQRGSNAGKVQITADELTGKLHVIANGGNGGRGEDGGDGHIGATGSGGKYGENGNPGGTGGDAGLGGTGGDGGACGEVLVQLRRGTRDNVTASCIGGKPGKGGLHGTPGKGGPGGAGGPDPTPEPREHDKR